MARKKSGSRAVSVEVEPAAGPTTDAPPKRRIVLLRRRHALAALLALVQFVLLSCIYLYMSATSPYGDLDTRTISFALAMAFGLSAYAIPLIIIVPISEAFKRRGNHVGEAWARGSFALSFPLIMVVALTPIMLLTSNDSSDLTSALRWFVLLYVWFVGLCSFAIHEAIQAMKGYLPATESERDPHEAASVEVVVRERSATPLTKSKTPPRNRRPGT